MSQADDPRKFGKVAVLMGGRSAEREVSLQSGDAVLQGLLRKGVDAHPLDAADELVEQLQNGGFERVFIVLHGRGGEDGVVQGLLQSLKLPYTGCSLAASALGMDKFRCKLVWQALGLPTAPFRVLRSEQDLASVAEIGFPVMVKPAHEGSSIGMTRVERPEQLEAAWREAARFDDEVLAEQWITGGEYTVSILGEQVLPIIQIEADAVFYDYQAKYQSDATRYHCPCALPAEQQQAMQELALRAFRAVGASGWGRVDFLLDQAGRPYLLEVNTVPGMTSHSLVPMAARAAGIDFDTLVWQILEQTLEGSDGR